MLSCGSCEMDIVLEVIYAAMQRVAPNEPLTERVHIRVIDNCWVQRLQCLGPGCPILGQMYLFPQKAYNQSSALKSKPFVNSVTLTHVERAKVLLHTCERR